MDKTNQEKPVLRGLKWGGTGEIENICRGIVIKYI